MCGISGILGASSEAQIRSMVAAMTHRGPDDCGVWTDKGIALGMARLSILDVSSSGHQPMSSADELIWIVYNGEAYNFGEQRAILESCGHRFASHSDTEVVLRMYEVYGDDFVLRLRGMFAFAIYDKRGGPGNERLVLARDQLGIKPLLYTHQAGRLIFGSELKAILASGLVERIIEPEALRLLLTFGSVTQPYTMIKGISALLPGHRLIIDRGVEKIEAYWRLGINRSEEVKSLDYPGQVALVRDRLEESVKMQMVSDVPLGAFLSGGVDSSLLVALMARNSMQKVKTFSVGFDERHSSIDESGDAEKTAAFVGTDHTRVLVTGEMARDRIRHIAFALDQPSIDGVNSYFVSLAAKQAVTVAISGTGGDELFAGYPWFITMVKEAQSSVSASFSSVAKNCLANIARAPLFDFVATGRLASRLEAIRVKSGFLPKFARIYQIFGNSGAASVLSSEMRAKTSVGRDPSIDIAGADELSTAAALERVSALCLRGYAQNQLLRDIDAVSMGHSLEVRVPFLDTELADLALSLPQSSKLGSLDTVENPETASYRATGTKRVLIDAGEGLLLPGMDQQPKRGFAMPFGDWLKGPLREIFEDALSEEAVRKRGFFDVDMTMRLKCDFLAGRGSWAQPWLLMMVEIWSREVLDPTVERPI